MTTIEPRTAVVTIYIGDHLDQIRHLERRWAAIQEAMKGTHRPSDFPEAATLPEDHAALVAKAEETAIHVKLRSLGRRRWRELVDKHPPREEVKSDQEVGVNETTFRDVLVPASIVEPALTEDDLDQISDADFDRLYVTAFALNRAPAASPKALRVSLENQKSGESSN